MSKRISLKELYQIKHDFIKKYVPYSMRYWSEFDYTLLSKTIISHKKAGRGDNGSYNDVIIMCDTETSKKKSNTFKYEDITITDKNGHTSVVKVKKYNPVENYVVAWTISIRAFNMNLVTLYGHTPDDFCRCIEQIQNSLSGDETFFYWHNLAYDWCFIRKFMFQRFGHPDKQLNTKSHYPICIKWNDKGIVFKDSLILAQRKLEKWADDLGVPHAKAVGKWDYDKIRSQKEVFTSNELNYIECDTLAGVECIDETMQTLKKKIYSMPYTATGIPREEARKLGKKHNQRQSYLSMVLTYEQYVQATRVYHGGYTHANRYRVEKIIKDCLTICRDFSSSYPFVMLSEKYPMESFDDIDNCSLDEIIAESDEYAFMFKLILVNPRLKDPKNPMPALQFSKCVDLINPVVDNGRILQADYVEIYLNEIDAKIIYDTYKYKRHLCVEVKAAAKDYLPRWYTDYVYTLYSDKCTLKDSENQVLYNIQKAKLNSLYGMCVMKAIRDNLVENYVTGEYKNSVPINEDTNEPMTDEELYNKFVENENTFLPYQWGVWVTSYAMRNLFELAKCCIDKNGKTGFVYSDTDSIYSTYWNDQKVDEYNKQCLEKLQANGYEPVEYKGKTYTLGVAEFDGAYSEFVVLGAKRYCCRYAVDPRNKEKNWGKLKITVAGVPKDGVNCLGDNIENFTSGFIFKGEDTGKLTHYYIVNPEITKENGIVYGDSIDLTPCDYLLSSIEVYDIEDLFTEEIEVQVYD